MMSAKGSVGEGLRFEPQLESNNSSHPRPPTQQLLLLWNLCRSPGHATIVLLRFVHSQRPTCNLADSLEEGAPPKKEGRRGCGFICCGAAFPFGIWTVASPNCGTKPVCPRIQIGQCPFSSGKCVVTSLRPHCSAGASLKIDCNVGSGV